MIDIPDKYEFTSMVDFADHMINQHGIDHDFAYKMDRYQLDNLHVRAHMGLNAIDLRRILDVFLSINNGESYPMNDITKSHFEEIIEKIDYQLDTGWTGEAYTIWMEGVGP